MLCNNQGNYSVQLSRSGLLDFCDLTLPTGLHDRPWKLFQENTMPHRFLSRGFIRVRDKIGLQAKLSVDSTQTLQSVYSCIPSVLEFDNWFRIDGSPKNLVTSPNKNFWPKVITYPSSRTYLFTNIILSMLLTSQIFCCLSKSASISCIVWLFDASQL